MSKTSGRGRGTHAQAARGGRDWLLAALLLAIFLAKLVVLAQLGDHPLLRPSPQLDSGVYLDLARQVAGGDLLAGHRVFFVSPFYIYFAALVLALTGGSVLALQGVQVALGTLGVYLTADLARRWSGTAVARVTASLMVLTGYLSFNEILIQQSAVDPFLTALGLWLLARAWMEGRGRLYVMAGAVLGLHALNRPNMLAWAAAALVLTALTAAWSRRRVSPDPGVPAPVARPARSSLVACVVLAAGLVAALSPAMVRNYVVAGEIVPVSSHGGLNFFIGNNALAGGAYVAVPGVTPSISGQDRDVRAVAARAVGREVSDAEASDWFYRQAWSWIAANPARAAALLARKVGYVFNAVDIPLNDSYAYYTTDERTLLDALPVGPWLLLPLGLLGLVLGRPAASGGPAADARAAWWRWAAFVPVYALSVAMFFVSGRYRMPLLVPLCLAAGALACRLWQWWSARRLGVLAASAACLAGLGLATNWPTSIDNGLANWRTEMILYEIDSRHDEAARQRLARAEAAGGADTGLLLYRVASAYAARGDAAAARPLFERALAASPGHQEIRLGLGQALLDTGRAGEAIPQLRAALAAGQRPDVAAFDLARALAATGATADAVATLRLIPRPESLDARSQLAVGELALQLDAPSVGEPFLSRAVALAPADAVAYQKHGLALALLKRAPEAVAALETACRLAPRDAAAHLNLAVLYAEAGRLADARREAQQALDLDPGYERARGLLQALDRSTPAGPRHSS